GEISLPGAGRPDAHDDVVILHLLEVVRLPGRLRLNHAAHAGQGDPETSATGTGRPALVVRLAPIHGVTEAQHVVRGEAAPLARPLDHAVGDARWTLHESRWSRDGHRVAAERDFDASEAGELHEVAVVDAGKRQRVGAFGREFLRDGGVGHARSPFTL